MAHNSAIRMTDRWDVNSEMQDFNNVSTAESKMPYSWEDLLGEPVREPRPNKYQGRANLNSQLPDHYVGENLYLPRELEGLINAMGTVFTTEMYPLVASDFVGTFEHTTIEFNRGLFDQAPWEGPPNLFTSSKKVRFANISHHNGGLKFEGDSLRTQKGKEEYDIMFQGVASVIQETLSIMVLEGIFRAIHDYRVEVNNDRNRKVDLDVRIHKEIEDFGMVNMSPESFNRRITETAQMLSKRNVTGPYYVLVPPGTIAQFQLESYTDKQFGTDSRFAVDNGDGVLERSANYRRLPLHNDIIIVEIPNSTVETLTVPFSPNARIVNTGSFYTIGLQRRKLHTSLMGKYNNIDRSARVWLTNDSYSVITMGESLRHANFPDMRAVVDLLEEGPKAVGRRQWMKSDFNPFYDDNGNRQRAPQNAARRAHMMLHWDKHHSALPVHFFGQMDGNVLSNNYLRRMAETLCNVCGVTEEQFTQAKNLFAKLDRATGTNSYFGRIIVGNINRSENAGNFVGQTTHEGCGDMLANDYRSIPNIREWEPNEDGCLDIAPEDQSDYPAGHCSYPGLLTIMNQTTNPTIKQECIDVYNTLEKIESGLSGVVNSMATDARNRSEWFHKPDAKTTLVEMLFTGPRDALFLRKADAGGTDFGGKSGTAGAAPSSAFANIPTGSSERPDINNYWGIAAEPVYTGIITLVPAGNRNEFTRNLVDLGLDSKNLTKLLLGVNRQAETDAKEGEDPAEIARDLLNAIFAGKTTKSQRSAIRKYVKLAEKEVPYNEDDLKPQASAPTAVTGDGLYYRSPMVVTSGLMGYFRAGGGGATFNALPSDPRTGHTTPLEDLSNAEVFREITRRPSYRNLITGTIGDNVLFSTRVESHLFANAEGGGDAEMSEEDEDVDTSGSSFQSQFSDVLAMGTSVGDAMEQTMQRMQKAVPSGARYGELSSGFEKSIDYEAKKPLPYGVVVPEGSTEALAAFYGRTLPILDYSLETVNTFYEKISFLAVSNAAYKYHSAKSIPSSMIRAMAYVLIFSQCDKPEDWILMDENNVLTPCGAIVARPCRSTITYTYVMIKPGPQTGVTIFGNLSTWVGSVTLTKVIYINISLTAGVLTKRPKNIAPIENAQLVAVVSGGLDRWIQSLEDMYNENPHERGDLLPIIVPPNEVYDLDEYIPALGYKSLVMDVDDDNGYPVYSSAEYLNTRLKAKPGEEDSYTLQEMMERENDMDDDLVGNMVGKPRIWLRDEQFNADGEQISSLCHFKSNMQGIGSGDVWRGISTFFKPPYEKPRYPIEV